MDHHKDLGQHWDLDHREGHGQELEPKQHTPPVSRETLPVISKSLAQPAQTVISPPEGDGLIVQV